MTETSNPPASIYLKVLLAIMAISVTLPIFLGYLVGLLLFLWIVNEHIHARLHIFRYLRGILPENAFKVSSSQNIIGPAMFGMYFLFGAMVVAAVFGLWLSPYSAPVGKTFNEMMHQWVKLTLLGSVATIALLESVKRGAGTLYMAKTLAVWMFFYFIYCLVQRYIGIDFAKGIDARLGDHRLAYGVYRVSGAMGHPLTLAYNLMIMFLGSVAIAINQWNVDKRSLEFKLWLFVALSSLTVLLISGSRFVLIVLVIIPFICELRRIVKFWPYALATILVLSAGLWLEGSIIGRFSEFFAQNQTIYERLPRLLFWKIHWNMFLDYPVSGVSLSGLDEATVAYYHAAGIHDKMYTAHNMFLQLLADSGLIGLSGLIVFYFCYLKSAIKSVAVNAKQTGLLYLFVSTLLVSVQQNNLRDSEFLLAFWFFTALQFVCLFKLGSSHNISERKSA
jgi:O-antigen ligase